MTITIIGTGYVGLTTAALLSNVGVKVFALDINPGRLDSIKNGRSFFYEEGIDALITAGLNSGNLIPTDSYEESISSSEAVFSCVGTPDRPDGSTNLEYVFGAAEEAAKHMNPGTIYAQKSTVPVGTGDRIEDMFFKIDRDVVYVSNPEFLREGTAVSDTLWFDRIVVGTDNHEAAQRIHELYRLIEASRSTLCSIAGLTPPVNPTKGQYLTTQRTSAELIKVTSNAFLALKISFANSIAHLADAAGADIVEVMNAVGADKRIGREFLNAGRGYGGGCFPKDVSGLIESARERGVEMKIMEAASNVNQAMPGYIITRLENSFGKLKDVRVAVLGLAFKAGTSDTRRSPAIEIANLLAREEAHVSAHDPEAKVEPVTFVNDSVEIHSSLESVVADAEIIIVATDWPDFKTIDPHKLRKISSAQYIVDAVNCLPKAKFVDAGYNYLGVGR